MLFSECFCTFNACESNQKTAMTLRVFIAFIAVKCDDLCEKTTHPDTFKIHSITR
eukprot:m.4553 g.4553  ORF g.4553 m.4553 type:complete len:55 (-) comp4515_c0_seq1:424-588(-)